MLGNAGKREMLGLVKKVGRIGMVKMTYVTKLCADGGLGRRLAVARYARLVNRILLTLISGAMLTHSALVYSQDDAASANQEYQDTEFGEYLYNETSDQTRDELARLLVDGHPSVKVFLQGLSMGVGIDELVDAAVRIDNQRSRDFVTSAASLLPLIKSSRSYNYSRYEIDDLEQPYTAQQVLDRFFEDRSVLTPFPDWNEGKTHLLLPASEISELANLAPSARWYVEGSATNDSTRPIFISMYEADQSVLVDSRDRIESAMQRDPSELLPVVFVYNKLRELSVDQLEYPKTLSGIQHAYIEEGLMLTSAPQWSVGDHHIMVSVDQLIERFEIRTKQDYYDDDESELWQTIYDRESSDSEQNKALLVAMLPSGSTSNKDKSDKDISGKHISDKAIGAKQITSTGQNSVRKQFGYSELSYASGGDSDSLGYILSDGMILNRPEKVAVAKELGTLELPVSFYFVDQSRVKPYSLGLRGLKLVAQGAGGPAIGISSVPPFGPPGSVPPSPPVPPQPEPPCASPPCRPF